LLQLKNHLGGQRHGDDESIKTPALQWLSNQAATFCDGGIQNLPARWFLNVGGNYVQN
jgi:hypothetical protein